MYHLDGVQLCDNVAQGVHQVRVLTVRRHAVGGEGGRERFGVSHDGGTSPAARYSPFLVYTSHLLVSELSQDLSRLIVGRRYLVDVLTDHVPVVGRERVVVGRLRVGGCGAMRRLAHCRRVVNVHLRPWPHRPWPRRPRPYRPSLVLRPVVPVGPAVEATGWRLDAGGRLAARPRRAGGRLPTARRRRGRLAAGGRQLAPPRRAAVRRVATRLEALLTAPLRRRVLVLQAHTTNTN